MVFNLIWNIISFGIDSWKDYKLKSANTELEKEKIEARTEEVKTEWKAKVLIGGSFWFQLFFIVPLCLYWSSVIIYSMLWCQNCIIPYAGLDYTWTIARLPDPFMTWASGIISFLFLLDRFGRRR